MKAILRLLILPLILMSFLVSAQVKTNFSNEVLINERGRFAKPYKVQVDFEVPAKDISGLLKAEKDKIAKSKETKAFQLAVPVPVDLDIAKLINWGYDNDSAYGKFTIKLKGALSSSINFDQFYLPNGTEMYIYNENGNMITGAISENENNPNKIWGSWVYRGQLITIEIKTPSATLKQLLLHSSNIAYGYKEVYKTKVADFGTSGPCEINVLCPLGNGWEAERNSVALILSDNGSSWCSGSMIMNACSTNRPFFLTANHCLTGQNVAAWRFTFQAWSPSCNPSQNANGVTYNGSTLRANWSNSDFCLVELNTIPPSNSGINYAGWTKSNVPAQNATGIHHPHGDVMKISRANNAVARTGYGVAGNDHWQANWSPQNNGAGQIVTAVTEGGSSGSPLFDQNHRIVGQLHGGPSFCGATQLWDYYGSFDVSWTGGGTNTTRLSNWLDVNNSGATFAITTNVSALTTVPQTLTTINGPSLFCTSSAVYTTNLQAGTNVIWSVTPSGIVNLSSSGNSATLTKVGNGVVQLTATFCTGTPIIKNITVGTPQPQYITVSNGPCPEYTVSTNSGFCQGPCSGYTWMFYNQTTNGALQTFPNSNNVRKLILNQGSGTYYFGVKFTNSCGTSPVYSITKPITCNFTSLKVSPNPSSSNITVETINNGKLTKIKIIDKMGRTKKEFANSVGQKILLNISDLPVDIYRIQVLINDKWETTSFIKQ